MSKPILTLPCKQNLQTLEKKDLDYYCNSCDKVLTDLRGKTNEEIVRLITNSPHQVCGIMHPSQMDYKRSDLIIPRYQSRIGLSLLGVLGFLGPILSSCSDDGNQTSEIKITERAFDNLHFPMTLNGIIKDHHSSDPLADSYVELIQGGKVIRREKTNKKGEFAIQINKKDLSKNEFELAYHSPDHFSDTIVQDSRLYKKELLHLSIYAMPKPIVVKKSSKSKSHPPYTYPFFLSGMMMPGPGPSNCAPEPAPRTPIQFDTKQKWIEDKDVRFSLKKSPK